LSPATGAKFKISDERSIKLKSNFVVPSFQKTGIVNVNYNFWQFVAAIFCK
jgi:hypothetical protein